MFNWVQIDRIAITVLVGEFTGLQGCGIVPADFRLTGAVMRRPVELIGNDELGWHHAAFEVGADWHGEDIENVFLSRSNPDIGADTNQNRA